MRTARRESLGLAEEPLRHGVLGGLEKLLGPWRGSSATWPSAHAVGGVVRRRLPLRAPGACILSGLAAD